MLYRGIFGWHGNICYVILINAFLQGTQSMYVPILRSIGTKLTNLENMNKSYVLFDVTWNTSDRYFDQEHFEPTRSLYQFRFEGGFPVLVTLTFDICSICCHTQ